MARREYITAAPEAPANQYGYWDPATFTDEALAAKAQGVAGSLSTQYSAKVPAFTIAYVPTTQPVVCITIAHFHCELTQAEGCQEE